MKERSLLRTVKMRQEVNEVRDDVTEEMKAKTQEETKEKLQEETKKKSKEETKKKSKDEIKEKTEKKTEEEPQEHIKEDFRNIDRYAENIDRDSELLRLLSHHPERGMEAILDEYGAAVETICRNFLYDCSQEDREEVVADTFFKLWKYRERIQIDEKSSLKMYLYQIARNTARDFRRKKNRQPVISVEEAALNCVENPEQVVLQTRVENPEQVVLQSEMEAILHKMVDQLKEPDRTIFIARYFYGFSVKEAAEKTGVTIKKAENILYRGKKRLEQALKAYM